ncbi:hypothetical protein V6N12_076319 [Hibiscus sabdariffa]|uniref:Uncharacterized protein n=1 Tax=Hibiscus sabdariffa TaxID=183260 RepID=A0ABR2DCE7_9ROSI
MPKSVFKKLGIGEAKPTTVLLQVAYRSYVQPEGKIDDLLVRVDKFIFPTDFLILDCEADEHAPIILGRPFLATSRTMIDFEKRRVSSKGGWRTSKDICLLNTRAARHSNKRMQGPKHNNRKKHQPETLLGCTYGKGQRSGYLEGCLKSLQKNQNLSFIFLHI